MDILSSLITWKADTVQKIIQILKINRSARINGQDCWYLVWDSQLY